MGHICFCPWRDLAGEIGREKQPVVDPESPLDNLAWAVVHSLRPRPARLTVDFQSFKRCRHAAIRPPGNGSALMVSSSPTRSASRNDPADRLRAHDWAATPLGPPESWPPYLRFAFDICLHSALPTA